MPSSKIKYICVSCGAELTEENSREVSEKTTEHGLAPFCMDCEAKYFRQFAAANGVHLGLFYTCLKFDVPCEPLLLPENFGDADFPKNCGEKSRWHFYIRCLIDARKYQNEEGVRGFYHGVSDILRIFGRNFSEKDFAKYVLYERERMGNLQGTEQQRERWGTDDLWKDFNVNAAVYDELDRMYENRLASYKGQTITPQMEDTIIKVCKWNLVISHLFKNGEVKTAKDVQSMVDAVLAAEQMRKKDEKPMEAFRFDAQVKALEDMGLMEEGKLLTLDGVQKALFENFIQKKKYGYSVDVLDHVIEDIYNTMRANADLMIETELPEELEPKDFFGEFEENETEEEKANKRFAGLTKVEYKTKQ